jgi:hypothetical protein
MIVAWPLSLLVLLALCVGLGHALERLAGTRLPGAVLASARSRRQLLGALAPASSFEPVQELMPARARSLRGQRLDWMEIVA